MSTNVQNSTRNHLRIFDAFDVTFPNYADKARFAVVRIAVGVRLEGASRACHTDPINPAAQNVLAEYLLRFAMERYQCAGSFEDVYTTQKEVSDYHEDMKMFVLGQEWRPLAATFKELHWTALLRILSSVESASDLLDPRIAADAGADGGRAISIPVRERACALIPKLASKEAVFTFAKQFGRFMRDRGYGLEPYRVPVLRDSEKVFACLQARLRKLNASARERDYMSDCWENIGQLSGVDDGVESFTQESLPVLTHYNPKDAYTKLSVWYAYMRKHVPGTSQRIITDAQCELIVKAFKYGNTPELFHEFVVGVTVADAYELVKCSVGEIDMTKHTVESVAFVAPEVTLFECMYLHRILMAVSWRRSEEDKKHEHAVFRKLISAVVVKLIAGEEMTGYLPAQKAIEDNAENKSFDEFLKVAKKSHHRNGRHMDGEWGCQYDITGIQMAMFFTFGIPNTTRGILSVLRIL